MILRGTLDPGNTSAKGSGTKGTAPEVWEGGEGEGGKGKRARAARARPREGEGGEGGESEGARKHDQLGPETFSRLMKVWWEF